MEVLLFALFFIASILFFIAGKDDFGRTENKIIINDSEEAPNEVNVEAKEELEKAENEAKIEPEEESEKAENEAKIEPEEESEKAENEAKIEPEEETKEETEFKSN